MAVLLAMLAGCASLITERLGASLTRAIVNQDDPATVRSGAPAYLLLVDGLIEGDPDDPYLLTAGARLYAAYATIFVEAPARAERMASKARDYGRRALCTRHEGWCSAGELPFEEFRRRLAAIERSDLPAFYAYAQAWASLIQARSDEWDAIADLPKVEAMMERVVALDEGYDRGQAHLYLGILRSRLPPALGGRPEAGREHFERAIELSGGRNLLAKVEFARRYARLVFDRELHDRLLSEVLAAEPAAPGLTLTNSLAQDQARELLAESSDYFGE